VEQRHDKPGVLSVFDLEPRFIGGTESYARELSQQLSRNAWRSVLCFVTPPPDEVRRFLAVPDTIVEVLGHMDGQVLGVLRRMAAVLRRYRPRIVHLHYTPFASALPWLSRLLGAERVFFTDHWSRPAGHRRGRAGTAKRWGVRLVNRPLSKVISVSEFGRRSFVDRDLLPADRCVRIYNGVDLGRVVESRERGAAFRARFGIPARRAIVLQVSWIIPEKGVADLLTAAQQVVTRNPDVHFVIAGEGPFRAEYTRRAVQLGLGEHVTWTGLLEDPFAAGAYDAADVVCQVSRWEEVFGWVIAEAMAYRKPLVATRVGGIPELVVDGESGFLVDRGDSADVARRVLMLVEDPDRRMAMGNVGRGRVEALFDLRRNVTELLGVYGIQPG
jgi:glycosyltransferase involved in cell wall biosynthesis